MFDVSQSWLDRVAAGQTPTPYILIQTDHGWRAYAENDLADLSTSKTLLCREARVVRWGRFSRTLKPRSADLLTAWNMKKQATFSVTLADSDNHFTEFMRHEPLLGKLMYLYLGFLQDADSHHIGIFAGRISSVRRSGVDFIIQAEEDSTDALGKAFYVPRAGQFANAADSNARLPIVYGDLTDGSGGNWTLPCIDTVNFVHCFAAHAVDANQGQAAIYLNGLAALPEETYMDEDCSSLSDWTENNTGAGDVQVVNYPSSDYSFAFFNAGAGDVAMCYRLLGAVFAAGTSLTIISKHDNLSASLGNYFEMAVYLSSTLKLQVRWASDGLYVHNGSAWVEAGTDLVSAGYWQSMRFEVDHSVESSATCDIYVDGALAASSVDCSYTGSGWTEGRIELKRVLTTVDPGKLQQSFITSILLSTPSASIPYTISPSNSAYGDMATVTFGVDCSEYTVTARGRGAVDAVGDLITDPVEIIDDFLTNHVGWSGSWNATAKARAQQVVETQGYAAAGVIQEDRTVFSTIQEIAGSFLGAHFLDGENKLVVQLDDGTDNWRFNSQLAAGDIEVVSAEQTLGDIVNQLPVQYAPNWATGEFREYDSGSTSADAASQGLYGELTPDEPMELKWVRSSTVAGAIQEIGVEILKKPVWVASVIDYSPKNLHLDVNDSVSLTMPGFYDENGAEMVNQICRVVGVGLDLASWRTELEVLGTGAYQMWAEKFSGVFDDNSPVGTPGTAKNFDGSWRFGGDRDTARY